MRIRYKHQKFQADAAKAVVDVFAGQPYKTPSYMMDRGTGTFQIGMNEDEDYTGWSNHRIIPELNDQLILFYDTPFSAPGKSRCLHISLFGQFFLSSLLLGHRSPLAKYRFTVTLLRYRRVGKIATEVAGIWTLL